MDLNIDTVRRLRFPVTMRADESIPSAVTRGVELHVLHTIYPVLAEAQVKEKHLGSCQLADEPDLVRLADVARCNASAFLDSKGIRFDSIRRRGNQLAKFGDLILPRTFLEFERRRIAPRALKARYYHRVSWFNMLLPYCSRSGERLVDQCSDCGEQLRWRFTRGLGHCESCGIEVAPSKELRLDGAQLHAYSFFASLCSLHPPQMAAALKSLPEGLQAADAFDIVDLILQIGNLAESEMPAIISQHKLMALPPADLARRIATGVGLTKHFPVHFTSWVSKAEAENAKQPKKLALLRNRLQSLTRRYEACSIGKILENTFPGVRLYASHGITGKGSHYFYTEARNALGLKGCQMKLLHSWPDLKIKQLSTDGKRDLRQYDTEQVDELAGVLRSSLGYARIARLLAVPCYAIEQLCLDGLLDVVNHPAVPWVKDGVQVTKESFDNLIAQLQSAAAQTEDMPEDAVPLKKTLRALGGGLKPWGSVFAKLLSGCEVNGSRIRFWIKGDSPTAKTLFVCPSSLGNLKPRCVELGKLPGGLDAQMSQEDAAEVLNIFSGDIGGLSEIRRLEFQPRSKQLAVARSDVITIAHEAVSTSELIQRTGLSFRELEKQLCEQGIHKRGSVWLRSEVMQTGLLG